MSNQALSPPDPMNFQSCFLVFHPFARVPIESLLNVAEIAHLREPTFDALASLLYRDHWLMSIYGQPLRWSQVAREFFDGNIERMSEAIYFSSAGSCYGEQPPMHEHYWDTLEKVPWLTRPEEGNLSPMLLNDIRWLAEHTKQRVWVYSHIGTRLLPADSLVRWWWVPSEKPYADVWKDRPSSCCMAEFGAEDRSWHIFTPCEALHSFFFGPRELLERFISERRLEGFWFDHHQHKVLFDWIAPESDESWVKWADVVLWT